MILLAFSKRPLSLYKEHHGQHTSDKVCWAQHFSSLIVVTWILGNIDWRGYFAKIKTESPSIFPLQSYTNQRILSISFSSIAFNVIPLQENLWQVLPNIYIQRIDVRLLNFDNKSFLGSQSDILQASLTKSHLLLYLSVSVSPLCLSATATWSRFII